MRGSRVRTPVPASANSLAKNELCPSSSAITSLKPLVTDSRRFLPKPSYSLGLAHPCSVAYTPSTEAYLPICHFGTSTPPLPLSTPRAAPTARHTRTNTTVDSVCPWFDISSLFCSSNQEDQKKSEKKR